MDASAYIKELKQKVARLNQEIACAQDALISRRNSSYPTVVLASLRFAYYSISMPCVNCTCVDRQVMMHIMLRS
jgi:hypothetical protein